MPGQAAELGFDGAIKVCGDGAPAVEQLSLTVAAGEICVLVGPSGGVGCAPARSLEKESARRKGWDPDEIHVAHPEGGVRHCRGSRDRPRRVRRRCPRRRGSEADAGDNKVAGAGGAAKVANAVSAKLTVAATRAMNKSVAIDKQSPAAVAGTFLKANGLA